MTGFFLSLPPPPPPAAPPRAPPPRRPRAGAPDRLRGHRRAAGAVDPEEDRAYLGVAERLAKGAADFARADPGAADDRGCRADALADEAGGVDQRNCRTAVMRVTGAVEIARQRDEFGTGPGALLRSG